MVSISRRVPVSLVRVRPDRLGLDPLPGVHLRERASGLARPLPGRGTAWPGRPSRDGRQDGRWLVPSGPPEPSVSANLGLRLIQLHLVLIYGMAGLAKLQGPGWWSGHSDLGRARLGRVRPLRLYLAGRLPLVPQLPDPRRPGVRASATRSSSGCRCSAPGDLHGGRDARRDRDLRAGVDRVRHGHVRGQPRLCLGPPGCGAWSAGGLRLSPPGACSTMGPAHAVALHGLAGGGGPGSACSSRST